MYIVYIYDAHHLVICIQYEIIKLNQLTFSVQQQLSNVQCVNNNCSHHEVQWICQIDSKSKNGKILFCDHRLYCIIISISLVYSWMVTTNVVGSSQNQELGIWNSYWFFHGGGRSPTTADIICLPGYISKKLLGIGAMSWS